MENKKIAVVGTGLVGKSWAMLFASGGYSVTLYDVLPSQVENALSDIKTQLTELETDGLLRGSLSAAEQIKLLQGSSSLADCVKGVSYIQECVPENLELKTKVFKELDSLIDSSTIIGSSTSAMPCSTFTGDLKNKSRCLVAHPLNPPYYVPLVELVPAPWTDPEVVKSTRALMSDIGQSPITLRKEVPGFIGSRIQYPIIMECMRLVTAGVISASDIDKILSDGMGLRYAFMGPLMTAYLNADGMKSYCERYKDMIYDIASDSWENVRMQDVQNPDIQKVVAELNEMTPLDKLDERKKWRQHRLAALMKLKQEIDAKDKALSG